MEQKKNLDPGQIESWSISDFLKRLSSEEPIPGGGSVSALAGALGAALLEMYCKIGLHRKGISTEDQEGLQKVGAEASAYQQELKELVTEDSLAYGEVMAAFKLPKTTDEEIKIRQAAIQKAFQRAVEAPFKTMNACIECLFLMAEASGMGSPSALSDLKVGQYLCESGARGALENIEINLPSIKDPTYLKETENRVKRLKAAMEQALHKVAARHA